MQQVQQQVVAYSISPNGALWVRLDNGYVRQATKTEWVQIWQRNPWVNGPLAA